MTQPKPEESVKEMLVAAGWNAEEIAALFAGDPQGARDKAAAAAVLKAAGWSVDAVTASLWDGLRL